MVSIKNRKRHLQILHGVVLIKLSKHVTVQFTLYVIVFFSHHHFSQHDTYSFVYPGSTDTIENNYYCIG